MKNAANLIGFDIGGTQMKAVVFSSEGEKIGEAVEPTGADQTSEWLKNARRFFHRVAAPYKSSLLAGVAAPGLASLDRRQIAFMPERLEGLQGLDWRNWLGLETPVPVFNDAHAALLGESWIGAARNTKNVLLLSLGTGVGGAAMVDGRILNGHIGRAGHLGHVSLNPDGAADIAGTPGSLEDAIGECTLMARSAGRYSTTRELLEASRNGSAEAAEIWQRSIRILAAAIAGFINAFDPELIVIGGGIAEANEHLFTPLQAKLDEFEWRPGGARVRLVKAALGQMAGATGAAYGAKLFAKGI